MLVEKLQLRQFRNFESLEINLDSKLNFFIGSNGHGKTSILESIGILASLRSFREAKAIDWIRLNESSAEISAQILPDLEQVEWKSKISLSLFRQTPQGNVKKTIRLNERTIKSSAQYLKMKFGSTELGFHAISFNPSDHDLIRGEPSSRRLYLDRLLAAENPEYFDKLLRYQKILEQRNRVLKDGNNRFYSLIPEFTEPLISEGAYLTLCRLEWIQTHSNRLAEIAAQIAPKQGPIRLFYILKWLQRNPSFFSENNSLDHVHFTGHTPVPSLEEIMNLMRAQFIQVQRDEQRLGSTLVGPHRDDWCVELNGQTLRGRGSQGEVRTALLALKLTEIESFRQATRHRPILLLDDFSSELDFDRRQYLMKFLQATDLQVLISSTESVGLPGQKFFIEEGTLK